MYMENENISAEGISIQKEENQKQQEQISSLLKMIERQNAIIDELRKENAELKRQEHERIVSLAESQRTADADYRRQAMSAQEIRQREAARIKSKCDLAYEQFKHIMRYK